MGSLFCGVIHTHIVLRRGERGIILGMDQRFKPVSIEIGVAVIVLLIVSEALPKDLTNPITLTFLLLMVAEFIRILYLLRKLGKEGVNISEQEYRSPVYDSISSQAGDTYAKFSRWRVYLIGITLAAFLILYYFFHINVINH
jgi:hypothetical protein